MSIKVSVRYGQPAHKEYNMASKNDQNFIAFCNELRAYVEEHHLFPDKHTRLSHMVKYTRKKINDGTLEEWKRVMFEEIAGMRDLTIHTGGCKKAPTISKMLMMRLT